MEARYYAERDPDIELMLLFNFILSKARSCNLYIPYTHEIYYGKRSESVSTSGSKKPKVAPRCLGVEVVSNGTGVVYEFSNSIVIIDANPALDSASSPGHQLESDEYTSSGVSASPLSSLYMIARPEAPSAPVIGI